MECRGLSSEKANMIKKAHRGPFVRRNANTFDLVFNSSFVINFVSDCLHLVGVYCVLILLFC